MKDSEFLMWLHSRLENQHGEDPLCIYMQKLKKIADKVKKEEQMKEYYEHHDRSHYGE